MKKTRLELTYEELSLLASAMEDFIFNSDGLTESEVVLSEQLHLKFETARAKLDPEEYKREVDKRA